VLAGAVRWPGCQCPRWSERIAGPLHLPAALRASAEERSDLAAHFVALLWRAPLVQSAGTQRKVTDERCGDPTLSVQTLRVPHVISAAHCPLRAPASRWPSSTPAGRRRRLLPRSPPHLIVARRARTRAPPHNSGRGSTGPDCARLRDDLV